VSLRYVTLLVVPDFDGTDPRRVRLPVWLYRTLLVVICVILLAPVGYVAVYYNVLARAAEAGRLAEENESLRRYQFKVQILEQSLLETQQLMAKITSMAGLDSVLLADARDLYDSALYAPDSQSTSRFLSRTLPPSSPTPEGLPAMGWISQGYSEIAGKKHPGIDLAMPQGTPVYATAFGVVTFSGADGFYGNMVMIRSDDTIETVYGHNRENIVNVGDTVMAGQRIAISGNTGKSSAPHLHYEIRIHGKPVNPIKYFTYEAQTH
jgi:murein DD-endopeptidase MepM/ murein hydrolase activator NlpD